MLITLISLLLINFAILMLLAGHILFARVSRAGVKVSVLLFLLAMVTQTGLLLLQLIKPELLTLPLRPVIATMIPPLAAVIFLLAARPTAQLYWKDTLHTIPAMVMVLMLVFSSDSYLTVDGWIMVIEWGYGLWLMGLAVIKPIQGIQYGRVLALVFGSLFILLGVLDWFITHHMASQGELADSYALLGGLLAVFILMITLVILALRSPLWLTEQMDNLQQMAYQVSTNATTNQAIGDPHLEKSNLEAYLNEQQPFLQEAFNLTYMAEALGVAPRALSKAINQQFNKGFSAYINDWKVEYAAKQLMDPDHQHLNVSQIMYQSGFKTKSSFNREFLLRKGMSPKDYRRSKGKHTHNP